jgi:hypothetical protein
VSFDGELLTVSDFETYCRELVPPATYRFLYGEPDDPNWSTNRNNLQAFEAVRLRPRVLAGAKDRNLATTVLGHEIDLPVIVGPIGTGDFIYLDETATARATASAGTIMVLSGQSSRSADDLAAEATGRWFQQVWFLTDRGLTEWMASHAVELGAAAIVLTVSNSGETQHGHHLRFVRKRAPTDDALTSVGSSRPAANLTAYPGRPVPNYQ